MGSPGEEPQMVGESRRGPRMWSPGEEAGWGVQERRLDGSPGEEPQMVGESRRGALDAELRKGSWMGSPQGGVLDGES